MKKKTAIIIYSISMILLILVVLDLFFNKQQPGSGFIMLFLMASATWGLVKVLREENDQE